MENVLKQPPRRQVTRADVARYAGVSSAVVSYVVNSGPKAVAPATRERVREAIRVLGYKPNAAARALKLGSTEMIGLILPDSSNPFFAELARAVEEEADAAGYALLLGNSAGRPAQERKHIRNLISRQVDGLLLASSMAEPDLFDIQAANMPVVLLNRNQGVEGFVTFGVDYKAGARAAVNHLIQHGHRTIALVTGMDEGGSGRDREYGWLEALMDAGLPEGPIVRVPFDRAGGYEAGKNLLRSEHRPTAVFASSDLQAIGVLRSLHEAGLQVPEEMAVVGFDGSAESEYSWPALTVMHQPIQEMAKNAVTALIGKSVAQPIGYFPCPTDLVLRRSCGCQPTTN